MASYSPGASQVLDLLHDRVVAFHPALVPILGGPDEALLVSQLLYWDGKGSAPARWIYKTQEEWQREVGLSPHRQRRARRRLRGLGVLEERRGGMPARLYYRLNLAVLAALAGADGAAEGALGPPPSRRGFGPVCCASWKSRAGRPTPRSRCRATTNASGSSIACASCCRVP